MDPGRRLLRCGHDVPHPPFSGLPYDNLSPVAQAAYRARGAAATLAPLPRAAKDDALLAIADALEVRTAEIIEANGKDTARAREAGTSESIVDRLTLTPERVRAIAADVRDVAGLPDPVGEVVRGSTLPNGIDLRQVRVPLGVVGIIYEARPNVTVDAAALCLKSGNAVLLRGSSSAYESNTALVRVLRDAVHGAGLPADAVQLVPGDNRDSVRELMRARGLVDVLIPRGGASLIKTVVEESTVPVIETGTGNCHVYVDAEADIDMAVDILINSKAQRPSVCNAAETLLVHADIADAFLPRALDALAEAGVTVHADERVIGYVEGTDGSKATVVPATTEDWETEYLSYDIAAADRRLPGAGRRAHPPVDLRAHRGDRHHLAAGSAPLHPARGLHHGRRERLHALHGRQPVRLRRRDRNLHAEAARPGPDGASRADVDEVHPHRRRPHPLRPPSRRAAA